VPRVAIVGSSYFSVSFAVKSSAIWGKMSDLPI
jgi:hypothetical protein